MREIITLQLGQSSNHVATHFWNAQESYFTYDGEHRSPVSHDVHWRAGIAVDGSETFLPRTVVYDLKGGFGSLRKINALYDVSSGQDQSSIASSAASIWNGSQVVQRLPQVPPIAYQESLDKGLPSPRLDTASVKYWSDFSRVLFHPRSVIQLQEYELDSASTPFDAWDLGRDLYSTLSRDEDVVDRDWRPFVEECDQMQAIQLVTTIDDAWGGFAAAYLERLQDEYPKTCVWAWGLRTHPGSGRGREQRLLRLSNACRSLAALPAMASTFVPLIVPRQPPLPSRISLEHSSAWHTSALLATGMETAALASRLAAPGSHTVESMGRLTEALNVRGNQPIARLRLQIDSLGPERGSGHDRESVDLSELSEFSALPQPGSARNWASRKSRHDVHVFGRVVTSRGSAPDAEPDPTARHGTSPGRTISHTCPLGFPVLDSFPHIYMDSDGSPARSPVGARTVLSSDSAVASDFKALGARAAGLHGLDDREGLVNSLGEIAEAYLEGWASDSDDDDL